METKKGGKFYTVFVVAEDREGFALLPHLPTIHHVLTLFSLRRQCEDDLQLPLGSEVGGNRMLGLETPSTAFAFGVIDRWDGSLRDNDDASLTRTPLLGPLFRRAQTNRR